MSSARSPLAPDHLPELPPIAGVTLRVARARYKTWDRCDLTFVTLDPGTAVAGVLTQSRCPSPEVEWCRKALALGTARALVVNAGNSNAFTGNRGRAAVEAIAARAGGAARLPAFGRVRRLDRRDRRAAADRQGRGRARRRVRRRAVRLGRCRRDDHDHRHLRQGARSTQRGGRRRARSRWSASSRDRG